MRRARSRSAAISAAFAVEHVWQCGNWVPHRVYRAGERRYLDRYWIRDSEGRCAVGGDAGEVLDVGEELSPTLFARVGSRSGGGTTVGVTYRTSEDGLLMPLALYDVAYGSTCHTGSLDNVAMGRCFPSESLRVEDATTLGCPMQPTLAVETGCHVPAFATRELEEGCAAYHPIGEVCRDTGELSYVTFDAAIELPQLVRAPDLEPTRRVHSIYIGADGVRIRDSSNLFDAELGTECTMREQDGGTAVCEPYGYTHVVERFSDAACTQRIDLVWDLTQYDTCIERVPFAYVRKAGEIYRVGAAYAGTAYELTQEGCVVDGNALRTLGAHVPRDQLPTARVRRDP